MSTEREINERELVEKYINILQMNLLKLCDELINETLNCLELQLQTCLCTSLHVNGNVGAAACCGCLETPQIISALALAFAFIQGSSKCTIGCEMNKQRLPN